MTADRTAGSAAVCKVSYKLVQISPIMILVNSGAFLSISSWFCELTELIFVMIPYISSSGYPPPKKNAKDYGYVQVANYENKKVRTRSDIKNSVCRKQNREWLNQGSVLHIAWLRHSR